MNNTIVHHEGATSLEAVGRRIKPKRAVIKIGLDVHARLYVAVAQFDQLLPKAARRLKPEEFVPWVEVLLGQGHSVHVVYEACGRCPRKTMTRADRNRAAGRRAR